MSNVLDTTAVGREGGDNAKELMAAYVATAPSMVFNHTVAAAPAAAKPRSASAGDNLINPGG